MIKIHRCNVRRNKPGTKTFKYKQSSLVSVSLLVSIHPFANDTVSSISCHGGEGVGLVNLSSPKGGVAYGIPKYFS